MRIALYHDLPPGGALRCAREMVKRSAREHEYVMFVAEGEDIDPVLAHLVHDVRQVPIRRTVARGFGRAAALARHLAGQQAIARAIDASFFDVAFFHPSQTTQAPYALSLLKSTSTLYFAQEPRRRTYEHNYRPWVESDEWPRRTAIRGLRLLSEPIMAHLDRNAIRSASVVATNSSFSVESIARAYGIDARLCHLGVDLEVFPLKRSCDGNGLLSVGALDPTKGHDLIVEALALLPRQQRPSLRVVHERSDPRFSASLVQRARDVDVHLDIYPNVSDTALADLYADAAATVGAARLEPLGLTPLESMAVGTPVLAVREGGYRETVNHGVNGVLVDRSARSLASGIERVLDLAAFSEPAAIRKSVAPYWTWDRCATDLEALLLETATR